VIDRLLEILETLFRHKLRTALTALSVAWGVFMLVVLLGAGSGLQNGVQYLFRDDATNSVWMWPSQTSLPWKGTPPGKEVRFEEADFEAIAQIPGVEHITGRFFFQGEYMVWRGDKRATFDIRSCHPDHQYVEKTIMLRGRFLDDLDIAERRKVAVIGEPVAKLLFGRGEEPLGGTIQIRGTPYTVIGVFDDVGGEGERRKIYVPITTAQLAHAQPGRMHTIMFLVDQAHLDKSRELGEQARLMVARRAGFDPSDKNAVRVRDNLENRSRVTSVLDGIDIFLWIVGIGTIIAGVVAASNIMLISVTERTREIGLRKALGATPGAIVRMIVTECLLLIGVSGYIGLVLGVGLLHIASDYLPPSDYFREPQINFQAALLSIVALLLLGTFAGYFPARRAARINPITALRDE
jgi:putative ABC transport system permease protein